MQEKRTYKITHNAPSSGIIQHLLSRTIMWLFGWNVTGKIPNNKKFILIGAPHTSNWDFILLFTSAYILRIKVSWVGKDTLFKKPFGIFMKWLDGIPVDRSSRHGMVDQIVNRFNESKKLVVAIGPSGTRKKRDNWKSGFYWIAYKTKIPILCGFIDFAHKTTGIGLSIIPTGDVKKDMDRIREFYKGIRGKYPELETKIKLIDEENGNQ